MRLTVNILIFSLILSIIGPTPALAAKDRKVQRQQKKIQRVAKKPFRGWNNRWSAGGDQTNANGDYSGSADADKVSDDVDDEPSKYKPSGTRKPAKRLGKPPQNKLFADENAKIGGPPPSVPPREQPPEEGTEPGSTEASGKARWLPYWMPICFFFDPRARDSKAANDVVKTVVDNFGKCDVAVKPIIKTLNPGTYNPDDPDSINNGAKTKCNANEGFNVEGTAVQTHPLSAIAADQMCGPDPQNPTQVAGCAELGNKSGGGADSFLAGAAKGSYGGGGKGGEPAASICDTEGAGAATHELGHNVGGPGKGGDYLVNEGDGKPPPQPPGGLGLEGKGSGGSASLPPSWRFWMAEHIYHAGPEGSGASGGFTPFGCASIRGGANDNTVNMKWNPGRKRYYKHPHPNRWINLLDGKKLFKRRSPPQIAKGHPMIPVPPPRPNPEERDAQKPIDVGNSFESNGDIGHRDRPEDGEAGSGPDQMEAPAQADTGSAQRKISSGDGVGSRKTLFADEGNTELATGSNSGDTTEPAMNAIADRTPASVGKNSSKLYNDESASVGGGSSGTASVRDSSDGNVRLLPGAVMEGSVGFTGGGGTSLGSAVGRKPDGEDEEEDPDKRDFFKKGQRLKQEREEREGASRRESRERPNSTGFRQTGRSGYQ